MANKREGIIAALKTQMQGISTTGGYQTNVGAAVNVWLTSEPGPADMPCLIIGDAKERVQPLTLAGGPNSQDEYTLPVELVGYTTVTADGATGEQAATVARQIIQDVLKAVLVDTTFGGNARYCKLTDTDIDVQYGEKITAAAKVSIEINYTTQRFNYTT